MISEHDIDLGFQLWTADFATGPKYSSFVFKFNNFLSAAKVPKGGHVSRFIFEILINQGKYTT